MFIVINLPPPPKKKRVLRKEPSGGFCIEPSDGFKYNHTKETFRVLYRSISSKSVDSLFWSICTILICSLYHNLNKKKKTQHFVRYCISKCGVYSCVSLRNHKLYFMPGAMK